MRTRTTVALDDSLLKAVDTAVKAGKATSRNDFLARALRTELKLTRRETIDAAFAAMANDPGYQQEAQRTAEEFAAADWEALQIVERDP